MRGVVPTDLKELSDEELQQRIAERLEEDPSFWIGDKRRRRLAISVEADQGEVILSGVVRTPLDRRRADILARALGATTVDNRLRVEEPTAGQPKTD
jgi:osmotically-inducible protein OsmY